MTDSAAYCKKAVREGQEGPNSTHILCLAHLVNLAAEVFHKYHYFQRVDTLIIMIKSSFFKKPGRKARFLRFLSDTIAPMDVKLPLVPYQSLLAGIHGSRQPSITPREFTHTRGSIRQRKVTWIVL